ncbi:MAG TPA: DNA polymerase/3'-5' exonuclease PolX [Armatimonadota bacterium]|nr:DNA polymerase/3'-5' exonuclease PolX [Armatimonadota bacterium]
MATNYDVARIFLEMAEALELRGEDKYRIRAYQNAARTILELDEPLSDIRDRSELTALPGIGESLAAKISEILDTGHLRQHDELMNRFPTGVIAMMRVPGIGPRTAETLFSELGIRSIEDLEQAAQEGKIRHIRGFGAKTEANILQSIQRIRRQRARIPLARAYPLAHQIVSLLRDRAPVEEIEIAGSLRRMKEDIGDIDILVTSNDPPAVMREVTRLPVAQQILLTGGTKTTILTDVGVQVDVRVVEPESFGAALQYFTGSKEHNIKLRTIAVKKGFKISEYGIFRSSTGERIGGQAEKDMYVPMGIRMFPPELREDRGEIELGLEGKLPRFVKETDIRGDLHVHSNWSDGHATLRDMALAAKKRGYEYIAISDHSVGRGIANGLSIERLRQQIKEIRRLNADLDGITILTASEVDIRRDGTLDYPDDLLAELDLCIASVHSAFGLSEEEQTTRLIRAMDNPYVDIIGHPTGRLVGSRDPINLHMKELLTAAANRGTAMEINCWPERLDLNDTHIMMARELGVSLVIDTDAHAPDHFANLLFGVATARRGWAVPTDILNTLPLKQFLPRLRRYALRRAA